MTTLPIWRLFPETFIATTYDLTNNEIGIYFRLLCWHWSNNKERFDIKQAMRISQCENDMESLEYILKRYFVIDEIKNTTIKECVKIGTTQRKSQNATGIMLIKDGRMEVA